MKMSLKKRLDYISNCIVLSGKVSVIELASELKVSAETIRKDLTYLEEKGVLYRTHGGAIYRKERPDIPFKIRSGEGEKTKYELCKLAINVIQNDDLIFVDPSTTALPLSRLLRLKKNVLIVTNCIDFVHLSHENGHKIILLGGDFSHVGRRTLGMEAINMTKRFNFDLSIFGTDGCEGMDGPGTMNYGELFLNKAVIKRSKACLLMTESHKFSSRARYQYAKYSDFQYLITDSCLSEENRRIIDIENIMISD